MRFYVMLEPQEGLSYDDILAVAQHAERLGFHGLYRSDHYTSVAGEDRLHSTDAWATLAGLARETERLTLGTLVTPVTFRRAGNLAKLTTTVADMAGALDGESRLHVGFGTGWLEAEHREFGFPFEELSTRFRRLEEHLRVVRGMWTSSEEAFSFSGDFEQVEDARLCPRPEPLPKVIVGGAGLEKTPTLAARYADELNVPFQDVGGCQERRTALDRACERDDRDPADVAFSLMTGCVVGATEEEYTARRDRLCERTQQDPDEWLEHMGERFVRGSPEQAVDRLGKLAEAGVEAVMLQHLLVDDPEMLDLVMEEIAPRL